MSGTHGFGRMSRFRKITDTLCNLSVLNIFPVLQSLEHGKRTCRLPDFVYTTLWLQYSAAWVYLFSTYSLISITIARIPYSRHFNLTSIVRILYFPSEVFTTTQFVCYRDNPGYSLINRRPSRNF